MLTTDVKIVCGPIVRRTSSTSVAIWVELSHDCAVHAQAIPVASPKLATRTPAHAFSKGKFTVRVGNRFYAIMTFDGLAPGWIYKYGIMYRPSDRQNPVMTLNPRAGGWWEFEELTSLAVSGKRPTFRTFPAKQTEDIRIAFGSCRTFGGGINGGKGVFGEDILSFFGEHLQNTIKDRLTTWPHLLLLLGDQIYADNVERQVANERLRASDRAGKVLGNLNAPESMRKWERNRLPGETKSIFRIRVLGKTRNIGDVNLPDYAGWGEFQCLEFEDFAALYKASWTDLQVARLFANVPTFMIFDDHDITNDWNLTGSWIQQMKQSPGWIKAVTEGLVAYWMYQGWGNPYPPSLSSGHSDDRFKILDDAALNGTDALKDLQKWFASRLAFGRAEYYYEIDIFPPIVVLDTRNDRFFVAPKQRGQNKVTVHADFDDEIISDEQWNWLRSRIDQKDPLILACGVPLLQLLCADWWLLTMGRSELGFVRGIEEESQEMSDVFEFYRRKVGIDQWTAFPKSFVKLTQELMDRGPFIFLSGDVHYSYAMYGRAYFPNECKLGRNPLILHAVSSPLLSQWTSDELKKNNPELYCHLDNPRPMRMSMRSGAVDILIQDAKKREPGEECNLLKYGATLSRVLLPDALFAFKKGEGKMKWTHLNNIGILKVWKDGKSVRVSWLGSPTGRGLQEIGSITSAIGEFVR